MSIGIRSKLLLPVLLLVVMFASVLELYIIPQSIERHFQDRHHLQQQQLKVLGITLEDPLLKGNLAQVHMTLNLILEQQPEWRVITLIAPDGRRIYPVGTITEPTPGPFLINLSQEITYLDETLGKLYLAADLSEIVAQQKSHLRDLFWVLIFLLVIASGASALMQDRMISRPLKLLANAASQVARGDFKVRLPTPSKDEVGRLIQAFGLMRDQRQYAENALHKQAYSDALTGLPNRAHFNAYLVDALQDSRDTSTSLALLFIDLDRFKLVNDTLGHEVGDQLLKEAAQRIQNCVRGEDLVARLGGDEFTVVVNNACHSDAGKAVANRVLKILEQPFVFDKQEVFISPSIGISIYPEHGKDSERLIKHADTAMYRAKDDGGNCYRHFETEMSLIMSRRMRVESGLRRAIEHNQLVLHYQPLISLHTGAVCGVEALIRWDDPEHGLIPPNEFIPLAEDTGLIKPISEWVLMSACTQCQEWHSGGMSELRLAVNLSAKNLYDPKLPDLIQGILSHTGMQASLLQLEITENAIMQNADHTISILKELRAMGIGLAIDDFGTGYSSLSYLKRFPIDILKIDRSFVKEIPENTDDTAITNATIAMAHSLKCKVVAEGVETDEQHHLLRSWSCEMAQGFLYSKPLPAAELMDFVTSRKTRVA